jgi:HAD superfamily hydrolase (TIGR01509 family)
MHGGTRFFDYGGVWPAGMRSRRLADWAAESMGASREVIWWLFNGPIGSAHAKGAISSKEFRTHLARMVPPLDADELMARLVSLNAPDSGMQSLVEALANNREDLCLISDSLPELTVDVRHRVGHLFRVMVFSDEERCLKIDNSLFDVGFGRIGVPPSSCVYVDDRPENLSYPRSLGATCILFEGESSLRSALGVG